MKQVKLGVCLNCKERCWLLYPKIMYCSHTCLIKGRVSVKENGCWIYPGRTNNEGYVNVAFTDYDGVRRNEAVHRLAYTAVVGPIPDDLCVCHICDTRNCANPEHLFLGTHQDNTDDMTSKDRAYKIGGMKNSEVKEVLKILGFKRVVDVARAYRRDYTTIEKIKNGRSYKHVSRV